MTPDSAPADPVTTLRNLRHELRTPINHIIGYTEMLLEEVTDEKADDFVPDLTKVHNAGRSLLQIVNEGLDPAKIGGQIDMAKIRHDLRTPLNQIIGFGEMLQEQARDDGHDSWVPDLDKICAAGKRLLSMVDGAGVQSPVEAPKTGEGVLPSVAVVATPKVSAMPQTLGERPAAQPGVANAHLLVVDDNEGNRDMLGRRLERLGYQVAYAEHGLQALEMLRSRPYDLVLLDIMMPVMDGFQALERLKADTSLRHVPVIMLSALDDLASVVRCIEMGADDYLSKPFNPVLLRARIGASLEKKLLRDQEVLHLRQIEEQKKRADDLLHVILPDEIVEELKATNAVKPRR